MHVPPTEVIILKSIGQNLFPENTGQSVENCDRFAQKLIKTSVEFITGGFHNPLPPEP